MTGQKEIYIAYESWHVDGARVQAARGIPILCLDFLVEQELKKESIPCISMRDVIDADIGEEEWWLLAQKVAREWYRLPAMRFFQYQGIAIGEVVEPILSAEYLTHLFYYVRIYAALKRAYPNTRLLIPARTIEDASSEKSVCLISFENRAVIDAARMVGFENTVLANPAPPQKRSLLSISWKRFLVWTYNLLMNFVPRRGLKIYASEYWSHIGPVIERMNGADLVLMNDEELANIPWRQLLAHRVRSRHPHEAASAARREAAMRMSKDFAKQWETAKKDVAHYLVGLRGELDWSPVLEAFEYLMAYAPRVIADIDAVRRIMTEEKPDIVLQLASVGGRHDYFLILARVAAQLHIPSMELQHAAAYVDPCGVFSRIETDYLATYGAETNAWYRRAGYSPDRLIAVGSSRFDQYMSERAGARKKGKQLYAQLGLDIRRPVLFVVVPYSTPNLFHLDSYQLTEYFETIRAAQKKIPGLQVLFKCRNRRYVDAARGYLQQMFDADYAIAGDEDIFSLLCASDAAVCGCSTVIFQVTLAEKPLVLYPWKVCNAYHAQMYAHAAPIVRTGGEVVDAIARIFADASYRDELLSHQRNFLKGYSFDGKASERMVERIERLSRKQK